MIEHKQYIIYDEVSGDIKATVMVPCVQTLERISEPNACVNDIAIGAGIKYDALTNCLIAGTPPPLAEPVGEQKEEGCGCNWREAQCNYENNYLDLKKLLDDKENNIISNISNLKDSINKHKEEFEIFLSKIDEIKKVIIAELSKQPDKKNWKFFNK